ncbi:fatty acid desaturase family protein [Fodinicola feengrottensis]|uniref:fatty acid desaturase family protein n=1 Tax=Fodinicola feengrottensis TaxID=435914 RepID=UPI0024423A21|nr:acyl-CoA desaturase [Fodinicola feengrottensis]
MTSSADPAATLDLATPRTGSDFAELSRRIKSAGLLRRRPVYYTLRIGSNLLALFACCVAFLVIGDSWWQLLVAVVFALVFTQLAFIGHDAGHKQIFRTRRSNDAIGYVHAGLVGLSYGWWVGKHNRHHANPNHEDEDPDIDMAVLAFSVEQSMGKRGFLRWMIKHQAYFFFPLLLLEGINLRRVSIQAVWTDAVKNRGLEAVLVVVQTVGYLAAVFLVLSPLKAVLFIAVHQALWGLYMGISFAPNHKGMPTLSAGHSLDFLRKQVLTSRNVTGGRWVDFALGGLNYQIEHHLFPNMPRANLRRAQKIVHEFCLRHDIAYSQCGPRCGRTAMCCSICTPSGRHCAARQAPPKHQEESS